MPALSVSSSESSLCAGLQRSQGPSAAAGGGYLSCEFPVVLSTVLLAKRKAGEEVPAAFSNDLLSRMYKKASWPNLIIGRAATGVGVELL